MLEVKRAISSFESGCAANASLAVPAKDRCEPPYRNYNDNSREDCEVHLLECCAAEAAYELWTDHIAQRIDEECEGKSLDFPGNRDTDLPNCYCDQ
jgi:hypothetical protein